MRYDNSVLTLIIDMQVDFTTGALANPATTALIPNMVTFIKESEARGEKVIFTRDTHTSNYLNTQEGKKLPVPHCIKGTEGHQVVKELLDASIEKNVVDKPNFGMTHNQLLDIILYNFYHFSDVKRVNIVGTCTGICCISNALAIKSLLPEAEVVVYEDLCACLTEETHNTAIAAMKLCQVDVDKYFK